MVCTKILRFFTLYITYYIIKPNPMNCWENVDIFICIKFDTSFITLTHVIERFHKIQSTLKAQHEKERRAQKLKPFLHFCCWLVPWYTRGPHTYKVCISINLWDTITNKCQIYYLYHLNPCYKDLNGYKL